MSLIRSTTAEAPLLLFDFVTHYGGSNKATVTLAKEVARFAPVLVADVSATCRPYLDDLRQAGVPVEVLDAGVGDPNIGGRGWLARSWRLARRAPDMMRIAIRLRQLIDRVRPKAVLVNSPKAIAMARVGVPRGIHLVWRVHGLYSHVPSLTRAEWGRVSAAIGVSRAAVESVQRLGFRGRTEVVHNGIGIEEVRRKAGGDPGPLPMEPDELRLIMPASLIPLKNHAMAIRGLANHRRKGGRARLWICGDIPNAQSERYPEELLSLARRLGVADRVHLLGWKDNIPSAISHADVMVLTSRTEGLPIAVLEAMALSKPVLATRVGGIEEAVRDGVDGLLVDVDDDEGFVRALARLGDAKERSSMGRASARRAEQSFSSAVQARRLHDFLNEIVRGGVSSRPGPAQAWKPGCGDGASAAEG